MSSIETITQNGRPFADFSAAQALRGMGNLSADNILGPYRCNIAQAEDGVIVTLTGSTGTRAAYLPQSFLGPLIEERAVLDRKLADRIRFATFVDGRDGYYKENDRHFTQSAEQIAGRLAHEGIRPGNIDTAQWLASCIFHTASPNIARLAAKTTPVPETVR